MATPNKDVLQAYMDCVTDGILKAQQCLVRSRDAPDRRSQRIHMEFASQRLGQAISMAQQVYHDWGLTGLDLPIDGKIAERSGWEAKPLWPGRPRIIDQVKEWVLQGQNAAHVYRKAAEAAGGDWCSCAGFDNGPAGAEEKLCENCQLVVDGEAAFDGLLQLLARLTELEEGNVQEKADGTDLPQVAPPAPGGNGAPAVR